MSMLYIFDFVYMQVLKKYLFVVFLLKVKIIIIYKGEYFIDFGVVYFVLLKIYVMG